jgi:hypothetical protein
MSGNAFITRSRASTCGGRGTYDNRRISGANLTPQCFETRRFHTHVSYLLFHSTIPKSFGVITFHLVCVLAVLYAYCSKKLPSSSSIVI